jgi:MFS transporter, PPP family, 3-phenylpropionic acid transporter
MHMKNTFNKVNLSFAGVQWFLWSGFGVYYAFFVPYLKLKGFTDINIGIMMSVLSFVGIIGPILWGAVSDLTKKSKVILVLNLLAGCICAQFIPLAIGKYILLMGILIILNLTFCSQPNVLDGWVMRLKSHGAPINYGLIRGAGSLAYALTSMIAGLILTKLGMNAMFPMLLGFECVTVLIIILIPDKTVKGSEDAVVAVIAEPEVPIHKNGPYILFVLLATVLYTGISATMTFYPILLQNTGGTTADLGLATGLMALSEFPVMFLSSRLLRRYKDTTLLLFAIGFYVLRVFLFFSMHSVTGLVWAQLTNSLSFGIFLPTSVHYINRITPQRTKATALSLASSMYMGVSGILGSFFGGYISSLYGVRSLYGGATIIAILVAIAFGIILLFSRNKTAKLSAGSST